MKEKLVIATTNKNKVDRIKKILRNTNFEVVSFSDMVKEDIKEPIEYAENGVDNAIEKASYYVNYLPENTIVLAQDDTIELVGVEEEDEPKGHIKSPVIKTYGEFTDELAAKYYCNLATKYGGTIPMVFKYGHAVSVKIKNDRLRKKVISAESKLEVRLVNKVYKLDKCPGYFLAALMEAKINNEWIPYNDLDDNQLIELDIDLQDSIISLLKEI
jgi:hypothetical protein